MLDFTQDDELLCGWLDRLSQSVGDSAKLSIRLENGTLTAFCADNRSAHLALVATAEIQPSEHIRGVAVWCGQRLYHQEQFGSASRLIMDRKHYHWNHWSLSMNATVESFRLPMLSTWAAEPSNRNFLDITPGIVMIHSADADYRYLAVKLDRPPEEGGEKRLHLPIAQLISQPVSVLPAALAEQRRRAIAQVVRSGGRTHYDYRAYWKGFEWQFNVQVCYLPGHNEVAVIITDGDPLQTRFDWKSELSEAQTYPLRLPQL